MSLSSALKKGKAFLRSGSLSGPSDANEAGVVKAREPTALFPKVDPAVDGPDCDHDCATCEVRLPKGWKIDESDSLYGHVNAWATHAVVATGKTDWVRDVADEKGSVMEAVGHYLSKHDQPENGKLMLSASNLPLPDDHNLSELPSAQRPTTVLLLPAFTLIDNVTPASVPALISTHIAHAPTTTSPLYNQPSLPLHSPPTHAATASPPTSTSTAPHHPFSVHSSPHAALILLCSQRTRDARCGQSAPLLKREFERHLRPLGLYRDAEDTRPGGVGIYFISHVGGHKYSANVMVYRRAGAFSPATAAKAGAEAAAEVAASVADGAGSAENGYPQEATTAAADAAATAVADAAAAAEEGVQGGAEKEEAMGDIGGAGAAQCIWLARVRPEDCEGIIKYTVVRGKVVKPDRQLRGGFDRERGLVSW